MDQKPAEAHLSAELPRLDATSDAVLRLAIDSAPSGVLIVDADGTIVLVNQQLEQQFGYSRKELVGQSVDRLLPKAQQTTHIVHRRAFMLAPTERPMGAGRALFGRRRDGSEFPVRIGLNPIETDRGVFVVASVVDLTERPELEQGHRVALEGQLDFERLVAELSVQFINLPADQIDEAIRTALGRIGEALQLDRCTFFRVLPDGALTDPVGWVRSGFPSAQAPVAAAHRFPWVLETLRSGQVLSFSRGDDIPNPIDRESFRSLGIRSSLAVPLSVAGRIVGAVGFTTLREERSWPPEEVHRLRVFANVFANVLARRESDEGLHQALEEVKQLRDRLQAENVYLRTEVSERAGTAGAIIGRSEAVRRVFTQIEQVAVTNSTVLLLGETGTGKELFATQIHQLSARRARAMVRVNCSAIPATLMESELFGREKGAFTGSLARQIGRFELADHSTIFLDEIGDLPLDIQVKLLRVLEERQIERLGSPKPIGVDTRIVAATHRNLVQRIADGAFREDLYYRLNVFPIEVPPLRERGEDIPLLVWRFVEEFSKAFGKPIDTISPENLAALQRYGWPGNIRELRNVVERAMIATTGRRLLIPVPATTIPFRSSSEKLTDVEIEHIRGVLESTGWRIRGAGGAAERLGLRPTTLETRLAKLGLRRPKSS